MIKENKITITVINGVTLWSKVEPITLEFSEEISITLKSNEIGSNAATLHRNHTYSKAKLHELVRECFEVKKLSFTDTIIELGVSPTTVRRVCRTLKIGRYQVEIPLGLRSNSSQVPYGWKSVLGVLEKEPREWRCVEMMYKLQEQGKSLHKIAAELTRREVPTKNGGKWFAKTVSQILKFNSKFLGT